MRKNKRRKTSTEITRFVIFMGMNYCINIALTQLWWVLFGVSVYRRTIPQQYLLYLLDVRRAQAMGVSPRSYRHPALTVVHRGRPTVEKPSTK